MKINKYMYNCLDKYGNAYLDSKTYNKLGKERILATLKKHGYDCTITEHKDTVCTVSGFRVIEKDYVIERV